MKYQTECPVCKHRVTAYTLPLNESLLRAFISFAEEYLFLGRGLKKKDLHFTNSQYTNFHNLRYFGLIEMDDETQEWHLTSLGQDFYFGESEILSPVAFMNGETLPEEHPAWRTHSGLRRPVRIDSFFPFLYKQRDDYRQEKSY